MGLFLILRARSAYRNVEIVSSKFVSAGDTQAIIKVCEFPPKESCKSRVNLESRYGMCVLGPDSSPKAEITLPTRKTLKIEFHIKNIKFGFELKILEIGIYLKPKGPN